MSFEWREYYGIAEEMLGKTYSFTPSKEARVRVAVSRAYYAAFGTASEWLQRHTPPGAPPAPAAEGSHEKVIGRFEAQRGPAFAIGTNLRRVKNKRSEADYRKRLGPSFMGEAELVLAMALAVIQAVPALDPDQFDFYR